ncbi:unnamed protein product [Clonostachys rosea f. rosea IK726]|uniref:Uncharacterized protein n=1 Tax=Clonostachys rosea f. rosea IK726 TaxID=1349383 RepID=A0ACA9TFA5_BIOOC|nr:unnamed protein product [Clonostachys rosea f. rosea IK726]
MSERVPPAQAFVYRSSPDYVDLTQVVPFLHKDCAQFLTSPSESCLRAKDRPHSPRQGACCPKNIKTRRSIILFNGRTGCTPRKTSSHQHALSRQSDNAGTSLSFQRSRTMEADGVLDGSSYRISLADTQEPCKAEVCLGAQATD